MRKFTTKRGFTIVEILVAFVIFAIMAAMISTILMSTNKIKQENLDIEAEIEAQRSAYFLSELDTTYNSTDKDGTLSFNFDGIDPFGIDYNTGDPNAAGAGNHYSLQYPVGDVKYDKLKTGVDAEGEGEKKKGGAGVTDRLDSRIYADDALESIAVKLEEIPAITNNQITKVNGSEVQVYIEGVKSTSVDDIKAAITANKDVDVKLNGGYPYLVYSDCTSTFYEENTTNDYRNYSQYRLVFPSPLLEYGYFYDDGSGNIQTQKNEEKADSGYKTDVDETLYDIYCPVRKMNLLYDKKKDDKGNLVNTDTVLLQGSIIRVASKQDGVTLFDYETHRFYIVLENELEYNHADLSVPEYKRFDITDITSIFGTTGTNKTKTDIAEDSHGRFLYEHYEEVTKDGTTVHQNVFGAYPNKDYDLST